jgi:hypothetical protein
MLGVGLKVPVAPRMHKKGAPTETAGNSHKLWLFVFNSEILRMDQGARSAGEAF